MLSNPHSNQLIFSNLKEFYKPVNAAGFSIKYVLNGTEVYTLNHEQHIVKSGQYLLSNIEKTGVVEIESKQLVKGICISLDKQLLQQVVAYKLKPDSCCVEEKLTNFFTTSNFLDHQYNDNNTSVGALLKQMNFNQPEGFKSISNFNTEFYYNLAERIVIDQIPVFKQLQSINTIKAATKKDLYKRILRAQAFMDAHFLNEYAVIDFAKIACLSEYHFYRLFKQVHQISPLQYINHKRLVFAKELISQQQLSITNAAITCGFADVFSFSKAFKKHFNITPSSLLN